MTTVVVICVAFIRTVDYHLQVPRAVVGTYFAHYGNVTQKLIIEPGGIYEQAITIGNRRLTNRGRWRLEPDYAGGPALLLKHSLSDNVAIGDAPGSFVYSEDNMILDRDSSGRTMIAINEDEDLYLTRR
jgi:hypothetical protein